MKTVENKKGVQALNEEELNQVTGGNEIPKEQPRPLESFF